MEKCLKLRISSSVVFISVCLCYLLSVQIQLHECIFIEAWCCTKSFAVLSCICNMNCKYTAGNSVLHCWVIIYYIYLCNNQYMWYEIVQFIYVHKMSPDCQTKIYCAEEKRCWVGTQRHYQHSVCQDTTVEFSCLKIVTVTDIFIHHTTVLTWSIPAVLGSCICISVVA